MKNLEWKKLGKKCRGYKTDYYDDYDFPDEATEKCQACRKLRRNDFDACDESYQKRRFPDDEEPGEKSDHNIKRRRKRKPKHKPAAKPIQQNKKTAKKLVNTIDLLKANGFRYVPNKFVEKLGPEAALYLTVLIYSYRYFGEKGKLRDDGSFFSTHSYVERRTKMSKAIQQTCEEKLVEEGLIEFDCDEGDKPWKKKWVLLNWKAIEELIKS